MMSRFSGYLLEEARQGFGQINRLVVDSCTTLSKTVRSHDKATPVAIYIPH
jgi:hypothetical protein